MYRSRSRCEIPYSFLFLDFVLQSAEPGLPEAAHEFFDGSEAGRPHGIEASCALLSRFDEPRAIEHGQVLRNRLLRDVDLVRDLANRHRPLAQEGEDLDAARLA